MPNYPAYVNPFSSQAQFMQPQQFPMPAMQQPATVPSLQGRFVPNAEAIMPQEVSMTDTPSLFPIADGSAIVAKQWAADGSIKTTVYVPQAAPEDAQADASPSVSLLDIVEQLDDIQDAIDALKQAQAKPAAKTPAKRTTAKKEAEDAAD